MNQQPLLTAVASQYFFKVLKWKGAEFDVVGSLARQRNHNPYNYLIDINSLFSDAPRGDPVDRTGNLHGAYRYQITRPWVDLVPITSSLDQIMASRVASLVNKNQPINLMWSGGIDSTAMVAAFLKNVVHLDQIQLVYTPFSLYENKQFFEFVTKKFPSLKTIDISGQTYMSQTFPGIIVSGHGGDEFTASLDKSFFDEHQSALSRPWQEFWAKKNCSQDLIDFSEWYFSLSGRPIQTLLEARWWFYANCKSQYYIYRDSEFLIDRNRVPQNKMLAFYDFVEFENYVWNDPGLVFSGLNDFKDYKKFLRAYTFDFFQDKDYLDNYVKINSVQFRLYRQKKIELLDQRWIAILDNGDVIKTDNLPLISKKEFDEKYGRTLDYLFNFDTV